MLTYGPVLGIEEEKEEEEEEKIQQNPQRAQLHR